MSRKLIGPGVHQVTVTFFNCFLVEDGDRLAVVDAGMKGTAPRIVEAVHAIGRRPMDVSHILLTHAHIDHYGGLAELKALVPGEVFAHPLEAAEVRRGGNGRPFSRAVFRPLSRPLRWISSRPQKLTPCQVENEVENGAVIDFAGGIQVHHTPGHADGHVAFLLPDRGVLLAGDVCGHLFGRLHLSMGYVDYERGMASLDRLCDLDFDVAGFGHGDAIPTRAQRAFVERWRLRADRAVPGIGAR